MFPDLDTHMRNIEEKVNMLKCEQSLCGLFSVKKKKIFNSETVLTSGMHQLK